MTPQHPRSTNMTVSSPRAASIAAGMSTLMESFKKMRLSSSASPESSSLFLKKKYCEFVDFHVK